MVFPTIYLPEVHGGREAVLVDYISCYEVGVVGVGGS